MEKRAVFATSAGSFSSFDRPTTRHHPEWNRRQADGDDGTAIEEFEASSRN